MQNRIPVNEPFAAVDESLIVQIDENLPHCFRAAFVHREAIATPVDRGTQASRLLRNLATGFFFPLPDALDKLVTAEVVFGFALGIEQALDDHLGCDARMIHARLP